MGTSHGKEVRCEPYKKLKSELEEWKDLFEKIKENLLEEFKNQIKDMVYVRDARISLSFIWTQLKKFEEKIKYCEKKYLKVLEERLYKLMKKLKDFMEIFDKTFNTRM